MRPSEWIRTARHDDELNVTAVKEQGRAEMARVIKHKCTVYPAFESEWRCKRMLAFQNKKKLSQVSVVVVEYFCQSKH